ncbi:hypothetical protein SFVA6_0653 [Shigella flexneri VA-6]|nr:hypothetical protein SF434370_1278 [Shigella flexneri 4343-70]EGJ91669.1 hypothetical protein SF434370_0486 [Shigella flexneri 4343-70]EGK28222.1 hypothetical protein SFVA6_0653 [Shigella flexneri VA-6]EIQ77537.1 hypothetical protein SF123566_0562 [Shigella flexneri 1235-66]
MFSTLIPRFPLHHQEYWCREIQSNKIRLSMQNKNMTFR